MGIQFFEFQSFPINCLSIECLDSRLRGNDESIRTETCIPSFPRKWESRTRGWSNCFYPISFCADRSGFPPARE
ncbi:pilus assembly protein PilS [Neisseria meningitidis]|uniref:Pilus assembly protein PilS n=1 Tax=Neisseria meningitidis TaxID=487 RepID=A0AB36RVK5_NEIME|nr:pilus assembly protein PilS [Neisseria meningitidis]RQL24746.1 pilus assembly protein PilS [Neisseria meningitidis]